MNKELIESTIEKLIHKDNLSNLEKDLFDTSKLILEQPLDRQKAIYQLRKNGMNYSYMFRQLTIIYAKGTPYEQQTNEELKSDLYLQLCVMCEYEMNNGNCL